MDEPIESVLAAAFPDRTVDSVSEPPGSNHHGNRTVRVAFANGEVAYLKVRTDGDGERNAREAAATRYARRHASVRAPAVLAVDSCSDYPYLATAPLAGVPTSEPWESAPPEERASLARVVGRAVAGIATARLERPGWIRGGSGDDLELDSGTWSEVLADAILQRAEVLSYPDRFRDVPDRVATLVRDRDGLLDGAETALVHRDARTANVLLSDGDGPPGVLDWESALVGDPGLGLCRAEAAVAERAETPDHREAPLRAAIREGYRAVAGDLPRGYERRRPVYRLVTFLITPATFDLWAPEADESTDELAGWVRSELDDRIAAARD